MSLLKAIYDDQADIPEEYQSLYSERDGKWAISEVEGVKTQLDVDALKTAAQKERTAHKETRDKLRPWTALGESPEEVQAELDTIPELKVKSEGGDLDEKKIAPLVDARVKREMTETNRELKDLREANKLLTGTNEKLLGEKKTRKIHDHLRKVGREAKVLGSAMDDILLLGERVFDVDENGKVLTKDNVGVTPFVDGKVWLSDLESSKPHWWGADEGSGLRGSERGGKTQFAHNPFTNEHWNVTQQGEMLKKNPERAKQMMKAAGAPGLGRRPKKKK